MAFLTIPDTVVTKEILPGVTDGVFRNSPTLAMFRRDCLQPDNGGHTWQENIAYGVLNGTSYIPGETFDLSQVQTVTGLTVTPRYYNVAVPGTIEKLSLELNGPNAVFSYIDMLLQNAALTMSGILANDVFRHGQNQGTDRTAKINGLDEALSDGSVNGFLAQTYTTYLTVTRTTVDGALNSPMTGPAAACPGGALSFPTMEQAFASVTIGAEKPNVIITTNNGFSYVKMVFQPQQRFETVDPDLGFVTLKFNGASIYADQYCPGARTATTADGKLGYAVVSGGETMWFLNTKYIRFYVSTDKLFGFGFTGFIPSQNSSNVAGHYKFRGNLTVQAPRLMRYLHTITA